MAANSIPEEIKQYRPGPCTEVKLIGGHYYVYMYESVRLKSGAWGKKTGKSIGTIIPGTGFVPNRNYHLYTKEASPDEISVLEYGQYALTEAIAQDVLMSLKKFFPVDKALQIFSFASILFANSFIHLDQVGGFFEQSWLSQEYKSLPFKMGKTALKNLLDDLGRRTGRVINYENAAICESSSAIALDIHAIGSTSGENDLSECGYKFGHLKEDEVNLLMGYDINTHFPLFSRMYRGSCNDKQTIEDISELFEFTGVLFVIDRGFYSTKNLKILTSNDNFYIIPVPSNTDIFKQAMKDVKYTKSFYFRSGKKHARIEYTTHQISSLEHVYVFRDIDENEKCRFNYQHAIDLGKSGYTQEKFEQIKEDFGVYVLQSNATLSPEEIFAAYKKRWSIETFYQYLKNIGNFNDLMIQDYYKEQGFAFIMLIAGQIQQKMLSATKSLGDNTISVNDVLLMARCMKMERRGNYWYLKNTRKKDLELLKKLGFEPKMVVSD